MVVGEWVWVGVAVGKAVSVCMAAANAWVSIDTGGDSITAAGSVCGATGERQAASAAEIPSKTRSVAILFCIIITLGH